MNTSAFFDTTGKRVRLLRQDRELSQLQIAEALRRQGVDVGNSYISQIENKGKVPSAEVLVGLAKVLETSTDYLLLLSENPERSGQSATELALYLSPEADRIAQQVDGMPPEARQFCLSFVEQFAAHEQRQRSAEYASLLSAVERLVGREQRRLIEAAVRGDLTTGASNGVAG